MKNFITNRVETTTLDLGVGGIGFLGCSFKFLDDAIELIFVLER